MTAHRWSMRLYAACVASLVVAAWTENLGLLYLTGIAGAGFFLLAVLFDWFASRDPDLRHVREQESSRAGVERALTRKAER